MQGFKPCNDSEGYLQKLQAQGYTHRRNAGNGTIVGNREILHATIVEGSDLKPHVLIEWVHVRDRETAYVSTTSFSDNEELREWLACWKLQVSRHRRVLK